MADLPLLNNNVPLLEQRTKINDTITKVNGLVNNPTSVINASGGMTQASANPSSTDLVYQAPKEISNWFVNTNLNAENTNVNTALGTISVLVSGIFKIDWAFTCTGDLNIGALIGLSFNNASPEYNQGDALVGEGQGVLKKISGSTTKFMNANEYVSVKAELETTTQINMGLSRGYFNVIKIGN